MKSLNKFLKNLKLKLLIINNNLHENKKFINLKYATLPIIKSILKKIIMIIFLTIIFGLALSLIGVVKEFTILSFFQSMALLLVIEELLERLKEFKS